MLSSTVSLKLSGCLLVFVGLCGCVAFDTSIMETTVHEGAAYSLPTTIYTVSLKRIVVSGQGDVGNLVLTITPKRVADPRIRLTLKSDNNPLFDRHHTVNLQDGLLSTVNIDDTGRLSDTIVKAAESIVAIQSGGMSSLGSQETQFTSGSIPLSALSDGPSREELDEFIKLVPNDGLTTDLKPGESQRIYVPGTNNALYLEIGSQMIGAGESSTESIKGGLGSYEESTYGLSRYPLAKSIEAGGVITRTVTTGEVTAKLLLDGEKLKASPRDKYNIVSTNSIGSVLSRSEVAEAYGADVESRELLVSDLESEIGVHQLRLGSEVGRITSVFSVRDAAVREIEVQMKEVAGAIRNNQAADVARKGPFLRGEVDKIYQSVAKAEPEGGTLVKDYTELTEFLIKISNLKEGEPVPPLTEFEPRVGRFMNSSDLAFQSFVDNRAGQITKIRTSLEPLRKEMVPRLTELSGARDKKSSALKEYIKDQSPLEAARQKAGATVRSAYEIFFKREAVELIDDSKIAIIPTYRSALGKSVTNLTITRGVLDKYEITHPSEAVEFVSIPKKVVEAIIDVPAGLFTKQTAQRQAELDLRSKEIDLFKKQQELQKLIEDALKKPETSAETYFAPKNGEPPIQVVPNDTQSRSNIPEIRRGEEVIKERVSDEYIAPDPE